MSKKSLNIFTEKLNTEIIYKRKKDPSLQIDSDSKKTKVNGYKEKNINFRRNKAKHRRDQKRNEKNKIILIENKIAQNGKVGEFR